MKKFKTRKKHRFFKILLIIIFIYIFYKLSSIIMKSDVINPQKYIKYLVNEGLNNQIDKVGKISKKIFPNIKTQELRKKK